MSLPIVRLQIPWPRLPGGITVGSSHFTLEIPLGIPRQNAKYPRKMLLYIAWAVYGQQGTLSLLDGLPLNDEDMTILELAADETYTFIPVGGDCTLCDIRGGDDRMSIHSENNARVSDIRDQISKRDDHRCVLVNLPTLSPIPVNIDLQTPPLPPFTLSAALCLAMHILPHSKGDEYIQSVFATRQPTDQWGKPIGEESVIETIDDPRNMIFFEDALHRGMETGQFAFLVVSDYNSCPRSPMLFSLSTTSWLTIESRLRLPQDLTNWPTFVVWHFWYGYSALRNWLKDGVAQSVFEEAMKEDYYAKGNGAKKEGNGNGQQGDATHHDSSLPNYNLDLLTMMWKHSRPRVVEDVSASHQRVADWVQQQQTAGGIK